MNFKAMNMSKKLVGFLILGYVAMFAATQFASVKEAREIVLAQAEANMINASSRQAYRLQRLVEGMTQDINHYGNAKFVRDAMKFFSFGWKALGEDSTIVLQDAFIHNNPHPVGEKDLLDKAEANGAYFGQHVTFHPTFRDFIKTRGYYDMFLIDLDGNIIYSVFKELDYATNLADGPYADSGLGSVYKRLVDTEIEDEIVFEDLAPYAPSNGALAGFIGKRLHDDSGRFVGVLALQLPLDAINSLFNDDRASQYGAIPYVIGEDRRLRTEIQSIEEIDVDIFVSEIDPGAIQAGEIETSGTGILEQEHYRLVEPFSILGSIWYVVIEFPKEVVTKPINALIANSLKSAIPVFLGLSILSFFLLRREMKPLGLLNDAIKEITSGNATDIPSLDRHDEVGDLARSFVSVHEKMVYASRIEAAVMASEQPTMVLDREQHISFTNPSMNDLLENKLKRTGTENKTEVKGTPFENLSLDIKLSDEESSIQTIEVNGFTFNVVTTEIQNNAGEHQGVVIQWQETTETLKIEKAITGVIENAARGDFASQLDVDTDQKFLRSIVDGMNRVTSIISSFALANRQILERVEAGEMGARLDAQFDGELGQTADALNSTLASLQAATVRTNQISSALKNVDQATLITDHVGSIVFANDAADILFQSDVTSTDTSSKLEGSSCITAYGRLNQEFSNLHNDLETVETELEHEGRHYVVSTSPILSKDDAIIGHLSQWKDVSELKEIEAEIADLILAASKGDFTGRLTVDSSSDFRSAVTSGMNNMSNIIESFIDELRSTLAAFSNGDLTTEMSGEFAGALGHAAIDLNRTISSVKTTINEIKASIENLSDTAIQASHDAKELSKKASSQAASIEQTSEALEEISITTKNTATTVRSVSESSNTVTNVVHEGLNIASIAVDAIHEIEENSSKISAITEVVQSIAFQTNLLALNAAVEAARAGESGRGFAVVATEVRGLSARSQQAAEDIEQLVVSSASSVKKGVQMVTETGDSLENIGNAINEVTDLLQSVNDATAEQTKGIVEINSAVSELDVITQNNSVTAQNGAALADRIREGADSLSRLVQQFKTNEISSPKSTEDRTKIDTSHTATAHKQDSESTLDRAIAETESDDFKMEWATFSD